MMVGAWWVWPAALAIYALFRLWYDNWRGPLSPHEVEHFMALSAKAPGTAHTDLLVLRRFMESDDGKEFVMANVVRLHAGPVPHPETGKLCSAREMLQLYFSGFVKSLLLHGGHPMLATRQVGGYIDAWKTPPDPGWTTAGMMRYRSRRDMMRLATDPRFLDAYPFKIAAVAETFSFPTQVVISMSIRPRAGVALLLALAAALIHLASLLAR
jgi:hypothetical protein